MELTSIEKFLEEIHYLRKKAELLDEILSYYDTETMTFDIPLEWRGGLRKISDEKLKQLPKSPRHYLNKKIQESIPYSEHENIVNYEKLHETAK